MTPGQNAGQATAQAAGWASWLKLGAALALVWWATRGGRRAVLVGALVVGLGAGCGINRATLDRETFDPSTGKATGRERMRINTVVGWPATQSLDKQRASLGKTLSVGQAGMEQETSNTNAAATIRALVDLMRELKP